MTQAGLCLESHLNKKTLKRHFRFWWLESALYKYAPKPAGDEGVSSTKDPSLHAAGQTVAMSRAD
jgi:hypothetical protein